MTSIQTVPASVADSTAAAGTAQFLSPVVLSLQALAVNAKQAHWNVRGANFMAIHELLDTLTTNAQAGADLAAERVVALGLPIDARLQTVAEKAPTTAVPAGFAQWREIVKAIITEIDNSLTLLTAAIEGLDESDLTSQDVAIQIKQGLEKDRWFLFAHIAE